MTQIHRRAVGDTLSKFATQLLKEGQPVDLTGHTVKFTMSRYDGTIKVPETVCSISVPLEGFVEFDFQAGDVNEEGFYRAFLRDYGAGEPDTYPADPEGIIIEIFDSSPIIVTTQGIPDDQFLELATAPRRTRTVEGTVEERSVDDLIKASNYLKAQQVEAIPWGIRVARTKPPGTCS